ncbi:MAG: transcriptional regulator GcvA [Acidiferrobacterales bacterium]
MQRLPPLNAIHTFEAAARHLSFHRAAEELHVTPSAVSHQIRSLEDFLGVRLFHRLPRQVVLTTEGQAYLPPIRAALDQIKAATERVVGGTGPLTMTVAPPFATGWLVPRLSRFQAQNPDIEVRLSLVTSTELVDFARSDVDLAIRSGRGNWPGLSSHRLIGEELVPVCSPALLEGLHPLKRPEDLRNFTLLHALPRITQWQMWVNAAGVTGVDVYRGPKFHNTPLALDAALAGLGIAIADRRLVARELESGRLIQPFDIVLPSESAYYLVYPEETADNPKIAAFRGWLLSEVATVQGQVEPVLERP